MNSGSMFWYVVIAASGAFVVLVGLLFEQYSEQRQPRHINDFRRCKSIKLCGEWLVIVGVFAELIVGIISASDEWQTRQTAIKNDPLNQPVSDAYAILRLEVKGTNHFKVSPNFPRDSSSAISLVQTNTEQPPVDMVFSPADARYFTHFANFYTHKPTSYGYVLRFQREEMPFWVPSDVNNTNDPVPRAPLVKDVLAQLNTMMIQVDFIPRDSELYYGSMQVFINGVRRDFRVEEQASDKQLSEWNPSFPGIFLFATHSASSR